MADQWTDFGSGFEDTGDGRQLEDSLFATGGVFDEEVKADAFEAVAAAQPSNPPPPPPIEQTAEAAAAEADAVRRLQQGEVATLEGVYAVLRRLSRSDQEPFPPSVSVRPRASPFAAFASDHDAFFVSRERAPPVTGPPQTNTVSVAFQSPLNGECWWDPLFTSEWRVCETDGAEISVGRERGTGPRLPREAVHPGTASTAGRPRRCG